MMFKKLGTFLAVAAVMALEAGPALAQIAPDTVGRLPGPGVFGLVALGVGVAIVAAYRRK